MEESATRDRILFEQAPVGVAVFDRALRLIDCNPRFAQLLNTRRDELIGLDLTQLPEPGIAPLLRAVIAGESLEREGPYRSRAGAEIFMSIRLTPQRDPSGAVVGGLAIVEDITERMHAEQALRRSEARFRAVIENGPEPIGVLRGGKRIYANPALARYLGFEKVEDLGVASVRDFIHPDDRVVFDERLTSKARGERLPPQEYRIVRRDGGITVAEISSMLMEYDGAPALICFLRDVTERRQLQLKLLQMDRMVSVGTLAAGVAHEINNPLAYLMANLDMVSARKLPALRAAADALGDTSPAAVEQLRACAAEIESMLATAREGAERVRDIVRDLKTFSRPDDERRVPVDVRGVLDASINMAWNEIVHRARLVKDYGDVPVVYANESRLGQVFVNLLVNAAQSLPAGRASEHEIRVSTGVDAMGRLVVAVSDTGAGIPPEHLRRIFDPFFTTKAVGVGTGLGLSICQGIITALGGTIEVESRVGAGTTFRVVLPPREPTMGHGTDGDPARGGAPGRRGRILVIDDEPAIANALRATLADEHDITLADSGRAALDVLRADADFDVVLCDLMMPEMTGRDLWEALVEVNPVLAERVVFVTGGAFTPREKEFVDYATPVLLEKPVDVPRLRALVRSRVK